MSTFVMSYIDTRTNMPFGAAETSVTDLNEASELVGKTLAIMSADGDFSIPEAATIAMQWDDTRNNPEPCPCGRPDCANVVMSAPFDNNTDILFAYVA